MNTVSVGPLLFDVPDYVTTVIEDWIIQDGQVLQPGKYELQYWTDDQVADVVMHLTWVHFVQHQVSKIVNRYLRFAVTRLLSRFGILHEPALYVVIQRNNDVRPASG
jgi:hypothetical protein